MEEDYQRGPPTPSTPTKIQVFYSTLPTSPLCQEVKCNKPTSPLPTHSKNLKDHLAEAAPDSWQEATAHAWPSIPPGPSEENSSICMDKKPGPLTKDPCFP